jgi:hypothetical protein
MAAPPPLRSFSRERERARLIHRSNYCVINLQTNLGTQRRQAKQGKPQRSRNFHQPESLGGEPAAAAAADCGCIFSAQRVLLVITAKSVPKRQTEDSRGCLLGLGRRTDQAPLKSACLKESIGLRDENPSTFRVALINFNPSVRRIRAASGLVSASESHQYRRTFFLRFYIHSVSRNIKINIDFFVSLYTQDYLLVHIKQFHNCDFDKVIL